MDGYTPAGAEPVGHAGRLPGRAWPSPAPAASPRWPPATTRLRDIAYKTAWADTTQGAMKLSGVFSYYQASWGVLSMMAMSGNFWDLTQ